VARKREERGQQDEDDAAQIHGAISWMKNQKP
jgi:hypothetical protein